MNYVYDLLTLDEVADYMRVTRGYLDTIRRKDKTFPETKLDKGGIRVKFEHLQNWIDKKAAEQLKERMKNGD